MRSEVTPGHVVLMMLGRTVTGGVTVRDGVTLIDVGVARIVGVAVGGLVREVDGDGVVLGVGVLLGAVVGLITLVPSVRSGEVRGGVVNVGPGVATVFEGGGGDTGDLVGVGLMD